MPGGSLNHSIVTARNLGLEKQSRIQTRFMVEDFLLSILALHGLDKSDIVNIALEKYLASEGYLNSESLTFINNISKLDKKIFTEGIL
jgi:hypothetical protein